MSIKNLFDNTRVPKIHKSVTSDELVDQVESSEFLNAKHNQHNTFIPPIDFATASNFAKFGSAELYYEKAFERIHKYYPYDGTLHEKIDFENSSSYLDRYVFDNLYPRTNGYLNFNGTAYISVFGGPHTASSGMDGKTLDSTFDESMLYDESKKRTSAFEFRGSDGITTEFWFKADNNSGIKTIFHVSGTLSKGEFYVEQNTSNMKFYMKSGSSSAVEENFATVTDTNWNHYAVTTISSSTGITVKGYKNGKLSYQKTTSGASYDISHILPRTNSLSARIGNNFTGTKPLSGSIDEFRFWKKERTPEDIFNTWFIPVGGGTNKYDANVALSCYFKFNEGITGIASTDKTVLDYSGRINNGVIQSYVPALRETGSAITEKLAEPEFKDPIIYSSHPDVISKKAEYKSSGSLADYENTSMFLNYFPSWMQETDEQNGKQLKFLSQVLGSYFDTLWHQISFVNKIHHKHYISGSNKALPFAKKMLYDRGFVMPDLFIDATKFENLRQKDDNEIYEKEINEIRNTIYHNIYNNLDIIYKSKGTEKSFRNFFRSVGIGQDVVKLRMYADDSTFVLRNNYEYKSYDRKFLNFNVNGQNDATIYQTSSATNSNIYIPKDSNYTGSFTVQSEIILPKKKTSDEPNYDPFPYLTSSVFGYHTGTRYTTTPASSATFQMLTSNPVDLDGDNETITLISTDGTSRTYRFNNGGGQATGDVISGTNIRVNVAVASPDQAKLANELKNAIESTNGHNGKITVAVSTTTNPNDTVTFTQAVPGPAGNTLITIEEDSLSDPFKVNGSLSSTSRFSGADTGLQVFVVHSASEGQLRPDDKQRVKFVLTGSNINLQTNWYWGQYENNKWSLAVRMKHSSYPTPNITGTSNDDYLLEFYGVEADGNTERNSFLLSTSSVAHTYYSSDKIFYAGAHNTNFTGSTLHHSDVKLGYLRYWHSYLSNDAIKQHAFDSETFGANEPFEQDLINVYPVEIPREKTLSFHWAFNDLTASNSSGGFLVSDLSSGSTNSNYGPLSNTIQRYVAARGAGFNNSSSKIVDRNYLFSARKRLPDDLLSSDLTTIKTNETEQFFVDENVSDNFYSFEKSLWGTVSDEMMNMFSTALDLNNLIGQQNQKYHHRYGLAEFLRDRFFDDVENEPEIERFTSFYKWIDDSISIAVRQLVPASARFSEKINNIIESHVLERNKYVHQVPKVTTFTEGRVGPEGSIRGITEMKYNWRFGHANPSPSLRSDETRHRLWHQERTPKPTVSGSDLRETLRVSRNNHTLQSSGLLRKEIGGTARISDTYSTRKFANLYNLDANIQTTLHGGTNFSEKKNLQLFHESIAPAGREESVPQNLITVGVGPGQGIVQEQINNDESPTKLKRNLDVLVGNRAANEYGYKLTGDFLLPLNIMSGTVSSGFNKTVSSSYNGGVHLTNLHNDVVGNNNETSIQGPFTEQHVGGLQYRHVDINQGTDSDNTRPEGWRILLSDHPSGFADASADGALGFVGPDYESPYPSSTMQKANRYRDEHAKRPVNIRNIKTTSTTQKAGNYRNELELFSTSPTFQKTWAIEAYSDPNINILPPFIATALPNSTHYQSLIGIAPFASGNIFGGGSLGNRQPDTGSLTLVVPVVGQTAGSSTFNVRGKDRVFDTHRLRIQNSVDDEIFEIDSSNNGVSQAGANAILTGSSDTDFFNNLKTSILGNLNGSFNVSYSAFTGSFSKGIQWSNNGAIGLSITSSLGTELDGLPFTFSGWVDVTSNGSSVNAIYAEETTIGAGRGRVLQIDTSGALQFIIHYVDSVGNKTDTYQLNGFRASYTGTLTHVAVVKGPKSPGTADSSLYINGSYVSWSSTSLGTPSGTATINSPDLYHIGWPGSSPGFGHTSDPGIIDDVTLLNISCSQAQIDDLYHGGKAIVDIQNDLTAIDFSTHVVAHYNFEESLGDVLNNSIIRDEKRFRNLVVTDSDASNIITQVTTTLPLLHPSASFTITPTTTGVYGNLTLTEVGVVFSSLSNGSGGVDAVAGDIRVGNDNVIKIPSTSSQYTSERNIVTRFSAPGGPEVQSIGYLDAYTTTYSVHNVITFRNLSVLGNGSGEVGTIRVDDHLGKRRGLKALRTLHMGKFGTDATFGSITSLNYPSNGSFNKQHRNTYKRREWSGSADVGNSGPQLITANNYDNAFINTPIPSSELQYSWIHHATSGSAGTTHGAPVQRIFGYAPRDGIVSSSAGYVEAIVFPTASSIFGS